MAKTWLSIRLLSISARKEYKKIENSAWEKYSKIENSAFWKLFKNPKNRIEAWR